jgi:hypothetical protein
MIRGYGNGVPPSMEWSVTETNWKRPAMVLGTAGLDVLRQSAPNGARQCLYVKHQAAAHHAYWKATYPGKMSEVKTVNQD